MEVIQKILNIEEEKYISNLNVESLKKKIAELFKQRNEKMAGKLIGDNEFTAYDKWVVIGWNVPNVSRKAAYLKGKITKGENGSMIDLKVKPNSILPIFAILSIILGLIITIMHIQSPEIDMFYVTLGMVFISIGIIYYPLSALLKNRLRRQIVSFLDLRKV